MDSRLLKIGTYTFTPFLLREEISHRIDLLANDIKKENTIDDNLCFLILLNGAYVFAAELLAHFDEALHSKFLKVSSYEDMHTSGLVDFDESQIKSLIGKNVIILEDIIDTGTTLHHLLKAIFAIDPASVRVACLLRKPNKLKYEINIDYCGFDIPDEFVIGYGLDYNGVGRNLNDIWSVINE